MKVCIDVDYRCDGACVGAVLFHDWADSLAIDERTLRIAKIAPYVSGEFYRRELPCILAILKTIPPVETVVIDGYVWLDGERKPGLGAHLYEALGRCVEVVGIAKTAFRGAWDIRDVIRGESRKPLYVSAAGISADIAAERVRLMDGPYRIPSLVTRVDRLCRGREPHFE